MKSIFIAIVVILCISNIECRRHSTKFNMHAKKTLPSTPKAATLNNYFGTSKAYSTYQP